MVIAFSAAGQRDANGYKFVVFFHRIFVSAILEVSGSSGMVISFLCDMQSILSHYYHSKFLCLGILTSSVQWKDLYLDGICSSFQIAHRLIFVSSDITVVYILTIDLQFEGDNNIFFHLVHKSI